MSKKIKKVTSLFLALGLLFSGMFCTMPNVSAYEENDSKIIILKDDSIEKIVKTSDEYYYYISKYNKFHNKLDFKIYDKKDNSRVYLKFENVGMLSNEKSEEFSNMIMPRSFSSVYKNENTFLNYEYTIYNSPSTTNRKWNIRRPKWNLIQWYSKDAFEYGNNEINLNMFKVQVDRINSKELEVAGSVLELLKTVGEFASAIASGGILAPVAIKGMLESVGASYSAVTSIQELSELCSLAYSYYMKVN